MDDDDDTEDEDDQTELQTGASSSSAAGTASPVPADTGDSCEVRLETPHDLASHWCRVVISVSASRVPTHCTTKAVVVRFAAHPS